MLFAMTSVAALTGPSLAKGLLSMFLGLMFATIGIAERLLSWDARQRRQLSSTTSGSTRAAGSGV
jgi:TctA family transporter